MDEDLKQTQASQNADDYANEPVPASERTDWKPMTYVWFGAAMFVGLFYTGVTLGTTMGSITNALIAILGGGLFLAAFVALNGVIGFKTGCNAALSGTFAYGTRGVMIPGFHIADIGWYIMMTAQFAAILAGLFPAIDQRVFCIVFACLFVTNGFIGFKQMAKLNKIAMPILLFCALYGMVRLQITTSATGGLGGIFNNEFPYTTSMAVGVTSVVGTWISGSSRSADYFRYAKTAKDAIIAAFAGFFSGLVICLIVGAFWGAGTGSSVISEVLGILGGGMIIFGTIMFFLQTWTTNEHSAYVTSTALPVCFEAAFGKKVSRRNIVIACALIGSVVAGFKVEDYYVPFISTLGILIPVVGSIVIADFYIMSKTKYHWSGHKDFYGMNVLDEDVQHHKMNWATIPTLIVGGLIGWGTTFGIPSINAFVGTIVSYCVFTVICYALGLQKKEAAKNVALAKERG